MQVSFVRVIQWSAAVIALSALTFGAISTSRTAMSDPEAAASARGNQSEKTGLTDVVKLCSARTPDEVVDDRLCQEAWAAERARFFGSRPATKNTSD